MKKFIISVTTNWVGIDQEYVAIANNEDELQDIAQELAWDNFSDFNCIEDVLSELFPDVEDEQYSDEQIDAANAVEHDYYGFTIEEWNNDRAEEEWDWYELVYDGGENEL